MKRTLRMTTIAVLALLSGTGAVAQQADVNPARCFLVATVFSNAGKEAEKPVARETAVFYAARLSGSAAQMENQLAAQLKTITNQNNGPIMKACALAMGARMQEIQAAQKAMASSRKK